MSKLLSKLKLYELDKKNLDTTIVNSKNSEKDSLNNSVYDSVIKSENDSLNNSENDTVIKPENDTLKNAIPFNYEDLYESVSINDGVIILENSFINFKLGEKTFNSYFPFEVTSILEIALKENQIIHPSEILFLDTETTGLSGGVGTYPFLIGIAFFKNEKFVIKQFFLNELNDENKLWDYLINYIHDFKFVVTYNGLSFDFPLIRTRLRLHKIKDLPTLQYFDLLHIFRRLYPHKSLIKYSQQILETELLSYIRKDDISGKFIPQIYFDYLKYKVDNGISKIIKHNQLDIMGMSLLFLEAIKLYKNKFEVDGILRSGFARVLLKSKKTNEAMMLLEHVKSLEFDKTNKNILDKYKINIKENVNLNHLEILKYSDLIILAQIYKRQKKYDLSIEVFNKVVENYNCDFARVALAKILEHRKKDYRKALLHILFLIKKQFEIENQNSRSSDLLIGKSNIYKIKDLEKRKKRLELKIETQKSAGLSKNE